MHRHIALLALPLALVLINSASCITSEDDTGGAGTSGTAGTTGSAGTNGAAGTSAAAGTTGTAGTNGAAGTTVNGNAGTTGTAGTNGAAGTGAAGTNGAAGTTGAAGTNGAAGTGAAGLSYKTDVEPILQLKCTPCHIANASGQLSLKTNSGFAALVTNGAAKTDLNCTMLAAANKKRVIAGDPDHSYLWIKVNNTDAALKTANCGPAMPETESGKTLTATEKTTIHDWIMQGAKP